MDKLIFSLFFLMTFGLKSFEHPARPTIFQGPSSVTNDSHKTTAHYKSQSTIAYPTSIMKSAPTISNRSEWVAQTESIMSSAFNQHTINKPMELESSSFHLAEYAATNRLQKKHLKIAKFLQEQIDAKHVYTPTTKPLTSTIALDRVTPKKASIILLKPIFGYFVTFIIGQSRSSQTR